MQHSLPDQLKYFYITKRLKSSSLNKYLDGIVRCIPIVTGEIHICGFKISSTQLNDILKLAYNCPRVSIFSCIIDTNAPFDFNILQTYRIKFLGFGSTGSNWGSTNKKQLSDILRAISKTSLKKSLTDINIFKCDLEVTDVQTAVNELGMKNVAVSNRNYSF